MVELSVRLPWRGLSPHNLTTRVLERKAMQIEIFLNACMKERGITLDELIDNYVLEVQELPSIHGQHKVIFRWNVALREKQEGEEDL